jgi:hypothetical protein
MMTSAKPMAISKSRVHTRISWRKESSEAGCSEEVLGEILGEIPAELFEFTLNAIGFSSECSILLPHIYNMSIAERARFRFRLQPLQQRLVEGVKFGAAATSQLGGANIGGRPALRKIPLTRLLVAFSVH